MLNQSVIGQTEKLGWMPLNIFTLKVISRSFYDPKRSNCKVIQILSCNISNERYGRDKHVGNILGRNMVSMGRNIHLVSNQCRLNVYVTYVGLYERLYIKILPNCSGPD